MDSRHLLYGNGLVDSFRNLKIMKTIRFLRNAFLLPLTLMARGYGAGMALSSNTITAGGTAKFTGGLHRLAGDRLPNELFPRDQSGPGAT